MCILKKLDTDNIDRIVSLRVALWKSAGKIITDEEAQGMYEINYTYFYTNMLDEKLISYYYESEDLSEIITAILSAPFKEKKDK